MPVAMGMLRLGASISECAAAAEFALQRLDAILQAPASVHLWRVRVHDHRYATVVGRLRGGADLMQAAGFIAEENGQTLALDTTRFGGGADQKLDRLPDALAGHLQRVKREIEAHHRGLEHPEISDVAAVSAALARLQESSSGGAAADWVGACETVILFLGNILAHPDAAKYRHVNVTNANFQRRIGRLPGGLQLLIAVGFREGADGNLVCGTETPLANLRARKLEIEAVLPLLRDEAERAKGARGGGRAKKAPEGVAADQPPSPSPSKRRGAGGDANSKNGSPGGVRHRQRKKQQQRGAPSPKPLSTSDKLNRQVSFDAEDAPKGAEAEAVLLAAQRQLQQEAHIEELQDEVEQLRDRLLAKDSNAEVAGGGGSEQSLHGGGQGGRHSRHGHTGDGDGDASPSRRRGAPVVAIIPDKAPLLTSRVSRFVDSHKRGRKGEGGVRGTHAVNTTRLGRRVITLLIAPVHPGDRELHVQSDDGFVYGQKVRVGVAGRTAAADAPDSEARFVVGLGNPLLLDLPLDLPHEPGHY